MTDEDAQGGRIFFSSTGRSLVDEDELVVLSVGVDIGSSTSHLVFSRIVLERLDSRYVVTIRETFYQSDILLTPYAAEEAIDAPARACSASTGLAVSCASRRLAAASASSSASISRSARSLRPRARAPWRRGWRIACSRRWLADRPQPAGAPCCGSIRCRSGALCSN